MESENHPLAVSEREAAQLLSVSVRTVQNFLRAKRLPSRKIGRRTVIPYASLVSFLRCDQAAAAPPKRAKLQPEK